MKRVYLSCWLVGISVYFATETVAIVGGLRVANEHQFPYQISVIVPNFGHDCGGGIIGDYHILIAAHCVVMPNNKFHNQSISILAGTNSLYKTSSPAIIIKVEKIYVPIEYTPWNIETTGDIAVLKLRNSLGLKHNKHFKKLTLPKKRHETFVGKLAKIAGFGWNWINVVNDMEHGNNTDGKLRYAEAEVLRNEDCQEGYLGEKIFDKHICARVKQQEHGIHGVCTADSGGPLVIDNHTVIGVLSFGPNGCTERIRAGIYTRVSYFLTFIDNAIHDKTTRNIRALEIHH